MSFRCGWTRQQTVYPALLSFMMIYASLAALPRSMTDTSCTKGHGIIFNSAKFCIRQPQIPFYGAVFTAQGMQLDLSKIQALQDLSTPDSQAKLQSFLGLINYMQPFIPSLSAKITFLCEQLTKWDWNPSTDEAFQCLKA